MRKHRWSALLGVVATAVLLVGPLSVGADAQTPSYYPSGFTLGTTAYTMRFAGLNRFQTAGTLAETGGVNSGGNDGAYPFDNPDRTNPGGTFDGAGCPAVVGVSAGDTPADALAASQAWETNLNDVPVHGGTTQNFVNTRDGYMLLTEPNRDASSPDLDANTVKAIQDLRHECGTFDSVVFGGSAAVSDTAINTLDALTNTVYQFAGTDRFDTARLIAHSVYAGNGNSLPGITDYTSATTSTFLPNTVFLAEGITGADALAIGPYAAENNIPLLLTNSGSLPDATRLGLIEMSPHNIVVLGGTAAISDAVATAAASAAGGATITRIAGTDRFLSSIQISERLFDNYPEDALTTGNANGHYSNYEWGFARSEGSGASHVGWPDALASAWFLGGIDNENECTPLRLAPPVELNTNGTTIGDGCPGNDVPLLLTTAAGLPASVQSYLDSLYPDAANIRTAKSQAGNDDGGFGFVFGGTAAVAAGTENAIAQSLSGGTYTSANRSDLAPTMNAGSVFYTSLDLTNYLAADDTHGGFVNGDTTNQKICAQRNAFAGSQWAAEYLADGSFQNSQDLTSYQSADSGWAVAQSRPQCIDSAANADDAASVFGISLSGHETSAKTLDWSNPANLLVTGPGTDATPDTSSETPSNCNVFGNQGDGDTCLANLTYTGAMPVVTFHGSSIPGATFSLSLAITRSDPAADTTDTTDAITVTGNLTVLNGATTVFTAALTGESSTTASPLRLSGMYSQGGALGAFRMTLTGTTGTAALTDLNLNGLGA